MSKLIWGVYIIMILVLIGIFAYGYLSLDWESILEGKCDFPEIVCTGLTTLGFPPAWLNWKNIIWRCIVPLVGITIIFYGFVNKLGFFSKGINIALALVAAISTLPSGAFVIFVAVLFATLGIYSVILFGVLAVMGFSLAFMQRASLKAQGAVFKEMDKQVKGVRDRKEYWQKEENEALKEMEKIDKMKDLDDSVRNRMLTHKRDRVKYCKMMQKTCEAQVEEIKETKKDIKEDVKQEEKLSD